MSRSVKRRTVVRATLAPRFTASAPRYKETFMTTRSLRAGIAACLCAAATLASAQTSWPDKPIRIVVPAPPGGSMDVIARVLADAMQPGLGQPIIVDNKPGGLGM